MHVTGGFRTGTLHIQKITGDSAQKTFREMASARVTGTKNENGRLRHKRKETKSTMALARSKIDRLEQRSIPDANATTATPSLLSVFSHPSHHLVAHELLALFVPKAEGERFEAGKQRDWRYR